MRDMLGLEMSINRRRVVLFDLGGVLVRVPGVAAMQHLAGIDSEAEVWHRWLACEWVRRFERGHCSASEFAAGVVADWDLPITGDEFLARFQDWPKGLYEGALEMVGAIREQAAVGCLSNTNNLHWDAMEQWGLAGAFDHTFLSYRIGLVKPDQAVFEHVAGELGVPAGDVVFLDDNAINVDRAANLGFDSQRVQGVDQAGRALATRGFRL
jgi:glucose-1-phosphatase